MRTMRVDHNVATRLGVAGLFSTEAATKGELPEPKRKARWEREPLVSEAMRTNQTKSLKR
jgi:hypothetical protein